jgi:hypothetical protein
MTLLALLAVVVVLAYRARPQSAEFSSRLPSLEELKGRAER